MVATRANRRRQSENNRLSELTMLTCPSLSNMLWSTSLIAFCFTGKMFTNATRWGKYHGMRLQGPQCMRCHNKVCITFMFLSLISRFTLPSLIVVRLKSVSFTSLPLCARRAHAQAHTRHLVLSIPPSRIPV